MKYSGSQIIVECLLEQGVDTIFGYPGGAVLNIYDMLYQYSGRIRHIITAHEQGAAHAADGYARSTGKTGVVLATSGPGATNLVTGIATAYMDSVPMVAITGNVSCNLLGLDSFQEVDITGITMPVTKHNYIVKDVTKLADTIRSAFRIANSGRKGPVLIDIPKDITAAVTEFEPQKPASPTPPKITFSEQELDRVVELICESERPMLYSGGGVISANASGELAQFAELCDAPVSCSLMGLGGFDGSHIRYTGMLGMHGTVTSSKAITACDLFVGVGTRFSDRVICDIQSFAPHAKIVHIDIDPAEVGKNIAVEHSVVGDVKEVLSALCARLPKQHRIEWMNQIAGWKTEHPLKQVSPSGGVTPEQVIKTLGRLTNHDAILTTEVGQHQMWAAQFYEFRRPRQFCSSGGLGTMGYGLGAAIGAQLANPDKRVVNIAGDGSFHMNCNELVTAYKFKVPIVELLFNNNVLGMVRQWQRLFYGSRYSQTTLDRNTDYMKLAEAYHIKGMQIKTPKEVEPVLAEALAYPGPVLVECLIDKDINALPMVPAGGSITEQILEVEL
ncbi:MAG: biosynthetic-type acetolactate synthase large subunit [Clostridiales bacterium]|nr:MAG: biosynthetic-type acetolactate synthase large subunit [Clostridiales bacterium]